MFTISESVRITKSQDGGILLDLKRGLLFSLNPAGTRILDLLRQKHSAAFVAARISQEFGAPEELVREDLDKFLSVLRKQGLLQTVPHDA
ncbi:MAG TPA: PqqD family protein [Terriglobales bacterium]|nr:PqqD family protein [Terriglobales bacterium]